MKECRDRAWRRWRADVKFKKILRLISRRNQLGYMYNNFEHVRTYVRKISIDENETIKVENISDLLKELEHRAKKLRDTPTQCSCAVCRNPRHSLNFKLKDKLTLQEKINLINFSESILSCQQIH